MTGWMDRAACRGHTATMALPDLGRDHGHRGGSSYTLRQRARIDVAKTLCARCPVFDDCAAWALTYPDPAVGMVAAGMTPGERVDVRFRRRVST